MLDDFFIRALVAGIGVALVAGPFGCVIVWRRLSYFGDTLSHAALLGVSLAFLMEINIVLAIFVVSLFTSFLLLFLQKRGGLPSDALLGLLSHSALAIGLVVLAFLTNVKIDLTSLLIGDILAVSKTDIGLILAGGAIILVALWLIWKEILLVTVNEELAQAEGANPARTNLIFMVLMALIIAISMKIVGVLLITALLIIPAAAARQFAISPERMALLASVIGVLSVVAGLNGSLQWDTPAGPSIVVAALCFFLISLTPLAAYLKREG